MRSIKNIEHEICVVIMKRVDYIGY